MIIADPIPMFFLDGPLKGEVFEIPTVSRLRVPVLSDSTDRGALADELPDPFGLGPELSEVEYGIVGWHNGTAVAALQGWTLDEQGS